MTCFFKVRFGNVKRNVFAGLCNQFADTPAKNRSDEDIGIDDEAFRLHPATCANS